MRIKTVSDTEISILPLANKHGGALSADVVDRKYNLGALSTWETIEKNASF